MKNETQHTPGPWIINRALSDSGEQLLQICTRATGVSRWHLASVMRQGNETEANARLIAAAPALLEALRVCLRVLVTPAGLPDNGKGRTDEQQAALDQAYAALALVSNLTAMDYATWLSMGVCGIVTATN